MLLSDISESFSLVKCVKIKNTHDSVCVFGRLHDHHPIMTAYPMEIFIFQFPIRKTIKTKNMYIQYTTRISSARGEIVSSAQTGRISLQPSILFGLPVSMLSLRFQLLKPFVIECQKNQVTLLGWGKKQ